LDALGELGELEPQAAITVQAAMAAAIRAMDLFTLGSFQGGRGAVSFGPPQPRART
jgi:hypothetical protein